MISIFVFHCKCLSFQSVVGLWKGTVFQNDQFLHDMTISLFNQNDKIEGSAWVISDNTSISSFGDAYLGSAKAFRENEKKELIFSFTTENNPEPTKIVIDDETWKKEEINISGKTKDNEKYTLFLNKLNFVAFIEGEKNTVCVNLLHENQIEISKSEKKDAIINIMIGSLLGGFSCLILFFVCFGDRNHLKKD